MIASSPLLRIAVSAHYPSKQNVLREVELEIRPREILGLAGVSGSGKSTLALTVLRLLHFRRGVVKGKILWRGQDLNGLSERALRRIRGREIAYMPQSPMDALNPMLRVESQLWEAWRAHQKHRPRFRERVRELMEAVGLPDHASLLQRRPRQLSVGQAQRVLIAMALLHEPALLIADEPTSALDVISRGESLRLLKQLNRQTGMALLFISHDLAAVGEMCDRVAILQDGEIVESGPVEDVYRRPQHPYSQRLIGSMPAYHYSESPGTVAPEAILTGLPHLARSLADRDRQTHLSESPAISCSSISTS